LDYFSHNLIGQNDFFVLRLLSLPLPLCPPAHIWDCFYSPVMRKALRCCCVCCRHWSRFLCDQFMSGGHSFNCGSLRKKALLFLIYRICPHFPTSRRTIVDELFLSRRVHFDDVPEWHHLLDGSAAK